LIIALETGVRLVGRTIRLRSIPGSLTGQAGAHLLETVVDGYDQLISEAEAEVDELRQGRAPGGRKRIGPGVVILAAVTAAALAFGRGRRWL
jgi:hypothetical protein